MKVFFLEEIITQLNNLLEPSCAKTNQQPQEKGRKNLL